MELKWRFGKKIWRIKCVANQNISNDHFLILLSICLCNVIGAIDKKILLIQIYTKYFNPSRNKRSKAITKRKANEFKSIQL